jgi:hypothetical protein
VRSIDLLGWLRARAGRAPDTVRGELSALLGASDRQLITAWWHPDDVDEATSIVRHALGAHGVELDEPMFAAHFEAVPSDLEEDDRRRHQLGFVAWSLNRAWAATGTDRRAHCFGWDLAWETGEPPWVWLTAPEVRALGSLASTPPVLERAYLTEGLLPTPVRPALDLAQIAPYEARRRAEEAFTAGKYEEALAYLPRAKADGSHGLLAEVRHVDVLRALAREGEARELVAHLAADWLSGRRPVWDTQWQQLHAHAVDLRAVSPDLLAEIAKRAGR